MADALTSEPAPLELDSDGVIRVRGTRLPLETIWFAFREGATAEEIDQQYPSLALADASHVIGHLLRHSSDLESYLSRRNDTARRIQSENESRWPPDGIRARLMDRRRS